MDQYPLPKPEDIFATLSGGKKFTTLDLSHAYNQLLLDEESRKYVTINTHKGLYEFNRLPFGINSAPAIFQHLTAETCIWFALHKHRASGFAAPPPGALGAHQWSSRDDDVVNVAGDTLDHLEN